MHFEKHGIFISQLMKFIIIVTCITQISVYPKPIQERIVFTKLYSVSQFLTIIYLNSFLLIDVNDIKI